MTTVLTATEAAKLQAMCGDDPAFPDPVSCEIVAGHAGGHLAFVTTTNGGELWWWLLWGGQTREIRHIDLCDGRSLDDAYLDDCLLPAGHYGPHSFDLRVG